MTPRRRRPTPLRPSYEDLADLKREVDTLIAEGGSVKKGKRER